MKDYYEILGIEKKASKDEIKKAFRTMAHRYHPDKKGGDSDRFKEVNEAYSVLSDEQKRANYDNFGARAGSGAQNQGWGGSGGFGDFDFSQFQGQGGTNGFEFDLGDIFGDVFGGGGRGRKQVRRGRDISIDIEINFEESIFGIDKTVLLNKISECDTCQGSGGKKGTEMLTCKTCNGKGSIRELKQTFFGQFQLNTVCSECHGGGKIAKEKCSVCHGEGIYKRQTEIKVHIPSGIENGEMIRLSGAGEAIKGGQAGDLYIKIHVKSHPIFRKEGDNLVMDLDVKLSDALLGANYQIKTLDGEIVLKVPEGINFGEILRIKEKGVPVSKSHRGDILIKVHIIIPKKLSKDTKKIVDQLRQEGI